MYIGSKKKSGKRFSGQVKTKKKAEESVLTLDKIDFRPKMVTRDKKDHYAMTKRSNH